ncbi:MAG: phage/plasmid primase, P4 family [Proteobacteria bacterium]|nr:phage/plasmid primase, P4 family [Pseudomonadota bacterium]
MNDIFEANRFLDVISGSRDGATYTFQTFDDSGGNDKRLSRVLHGTLKQHHLELSKLNSEGAGVFVVINQSNQCGRKKSDILAVRAQFVDKDDGPIDQSLLNILQPSIVVETKRGSHAYFVISDGIQSLDKFSDTQSLLAKFFSSDEKVKDLPRVMRLPGFYHRKNRNEPFLVKITQVSNLQYEQEDIRRILQGANEDFGIYVNSLSTKEGHRNNNVVRLCREGLGRGIPAEQLKVYLEEYCDRSSLPYDEAMGIFDRSVKEHAKKPFTSRSQLGNEYRQLAHQYLQSTGYYINEEMRFRYIKGEFYKYNGCHYEPINMDVLKASIMNYLNKAGVKFKKQSTAAHEIMENIRAICIVEAPLDEPFWLDNSEKSSKNLVICSNNIIDLIPVRAGKDPIYYKPTPNLFSLASVPYSFDSSKTCKTWESFLESSLPNAELRNLLQEAFGYSLLRDACFQKFFILCGEGANGKSVILLVLRLLLGKENISSVGLEAFDPSRTFPLAGMIGKLANIVEELSEIDKSSEGILKAIVTGGAITVEKKHRDPITTTLPIKLFFATNILPKFRDRSKAIWRRLLIIPFENSILDETKQDKRLIDANFWIESDELPGILNWSLAGLRRLMTRGHFEEPAVSRDEKFKLDLISCPAREFLLEHCKLCDNSSTPKNHIYAEYRMWSERNGYRPFAAGRFGDEIRSTFPSVKSTDHAQKIGDGSRDRLWISLKYRSTLAYRASSEF